MLHSVLQTGLADDIGLDASNGNARDVAATGEQRRIALRKMLSDMLAQKAALGKTQVGKKRAYDDPRLLPSHNRLKRQREWQAQVLLLWWGCCRRCCVYGRGGGRYLCMVK